MHTSAASAEGALETKNQLIEKAIATWHLWWQISKDLLRLTLQRRLWGLIGNHLKTIVGKRDRRSILLKKSWADLTKSLKAIKAQRDRWDFKSRRESTFSYISDDGTWPGTPYSREEERKHKNPAGVPIVHELPLPRLLEHMGAEDGPSDAEEKRGEML